MEYYLIDYPRYASKLGEEDLKKFKRAGLECHLATTNEAAKELKDSTMFRWGRSIVISVRDAEDLTKIQQATNTYIWIDPKRRTIIPTPYEPN